MRRALAAAAAAALLALAAGCGGSHAPSAAACKTAMKQEYAAARETGKTQTEPGACKGLPAAEINKLAGEVVAEVLSGR